MKKRFLGFILALTLLVNMCAIAPLNASAANGTMQYIYPSGTMFYVRPFYTVDAFKIVDSRSQCISPDVTDKTLYVENACLLEAAEQVEISLTKVVSGTTLEKYKEAIWDEEKLKYVPFSGELESYYISTMPGENAPTSIRLEDGTYIVGITKGGDGVLTRIVVGSGENPIAVYLNDKKINFDVPPIIDSGRTLVPLRAIFEAMGMAVNWDSSTSTVTALGNGNSISMRVNETAAIVNGETRTMDVPSKIIDGRTLVPVRFIAESVNAKIEWDGTNRIVDIKYTPDENYKIFTVNYSDKIEAYKFDSGYYVDSSAILPLLFGYDDKYNDLSGILKIWDNDVNIGLNIPYDLNFNNESDYVSLEIKCSDGTLLKDSVYKSHYKKTNVVMTRKGDKSYINLDDIVWLNNYIIVDDSQILPDLVSNSVRTILDNDVISNPTNEFGNKKWAFSGWQIGWTDKELEDYINYQEIWGDIALCSLAVFDGEGFDIFKKRINAMVDVLVMPSEEQLNENIQSKLQQSENGDLLIDFGKNLSSYDDTFIELTEVYKNSPKVHKVMKDISVSSGILFTWFDAYAETYEEVLSIQAIMECTENNRRILESFVNELPYEYKKDCSSAFEIISERLKQYENYNYGKMFLKNLAEKGGSLVVRSVIKEVIDAGIESSKGKFVYNIGTCALEMGRYAIDVLAKNQLEGIEKQGVFHALYDFNNIAYNRYVDLYNQRTQYLHDLPVSYQESLKNAAIISILTGNESRRTFINARELLLTKSQLKKNEVGHQALLNYCNEVDFLLNKWKSASIQ